MSNIWWEELLKRSGFTFILTLKLVQLICLCSGSWLNQNSPCILSMWLIGLSARFNHELVFGVSIKNMNKAERLIFGESLMTHAMVLTAVTEKVESPSWSSGAGRDVLEYPGSFFVSWAHSECATTSWCTRPGCLFPLCCLCLSVQNYKYLTRREDF